MSITVSLWSKKEGEIRRFLEKYYQCEVFIDEDVDKWSYIYRNPLQSADIISALMDNYDDYNIAIGVQVNNGELYHINEDNHNDVIKGLFCLFYKEGLPEQYEENTYHLNTNK